jgi:imidazolonepropionase-like amidohydrolase
VKRTTDLTVRALASFAVVVALGCDSRPSEPITALVGGLLIDATGAPPVENAVVVMQGRRILAAGPEDRTPLPPGAVAYDVSGRTIMPGLVEGNSHIIFSGQSDHLRYFVERADRYYEIGARNLYTSLMQGITTTRDTMDPLEEMLRLREDVQAGRIAGSRLLTSGTILHYPGVHRMFREDNPDLVGMDPENIEKARTALVRTVHDGGGRDVVRQKAARGVDFIKVSAYSGPEDVPPVLTGAQLKEIVDEANVLGLPVTTHTSSVASVQAVLDAGVNAMEHPTLVANDEVGPQGEFPDALVEQIVRQNIYSVPLMVVREVYVTYLEDPSRLEDPFYIQHAPADMVNEAALGSFAAHRGS